MNNIKELKEQLSEKISLSDKVLIVPHTRPDFDALGSSVGLVKICNKLNKDSYILIDDDYSKLDQSLSRMIFDISEEYQVIDVKKYLELLGNNDLLVTTDVNGYSRIAIRDYLEKFKRKIIIDHHLKSRETIEADYEYIDINTSSASEIVTKLLRAYNVKFDSKCATYLYAGIVLDSKNFTQDVTEKTFIDSGFLLKKGANTSYVNSLFKENFENDKKIHELIGYSEFINLCYVIAAGKEKIYTKEDLAKAANYILKYSADASFAVGLIGDNEIGISSRSNGNVNVNVGLIMQQFGGGGSSTSAAATIEGTDVESAVKKLKLVLNPNQVLDA